MTLGRRERPRRKGPPAPRIKPRRHEDRDHLAEVAELPCCVPGCAAWPVEVHHLRTCPDGTNRGTSQKASDDETIPLCPHHHRLGPPGEGFHNGPREFEARHGTELELLEKTRRDLKEKAEREDPFAHLRRPSACL